jgi:hypothetical protein
MPLLRASYAHCYSLTLKYAVTSCLLILMLLPVSYVWRYFLFLKPNVTTCLLRPLLLLLS